MSLILVGLMSVLATPARAVNPTALATVGSATAVSVVDVTALTPPVTITVVPDLPAGLSVDATGQLVGLPTAASSTVTYTVTANDGVASPVVQLVDIRVDGKLTPPADISTAFGQPITGSPTVTVSGLGAGVTYSLTGAPTWLAISTTGVLSGTPTAAQPTTPVTVTALDSAGASATGSFNLTVLDALSPPTQSISGVVGSPFAVPSVPLTASTPGTFVINPPVATIPGLTFDTATGVIAGTPAKPVGPTPFTVQFLPTSNGTPLQATITVSVDAVLGVGAQTITGTVGTNIVAFIGYASTVATTAGLVAPFAYSTTPALPGATSPGDLTINPTTGAVTGRPSTAVVGAKFTVNVTDKNGAKGSGPVTITIGGQLLPASQALVGSVGATVTSRTMAANGMTAPVTYSITPALPTGMSLNTATGVVSGIPRAVQATTSFDISATDANGSTGAAKLTVTVGKALLSPPVIGAIQPGPRAGSIVVNFTPPRLAPSDQTYTVQVYDSTGSDLVTSVDTKSSPVTIDGLTPGETYQVVVVANATSSYDRMESLPKSAVASTTTSSASVTTTTSAAGTVAPKKPSTTTSLSQLGLLLGVGSQVTTAKKVTLVGLPSRTVATAPVVRIATNSFTRLVLQGVQLKGPLTIKVRSTTGAWLLLGTAKANAKHIVKLPVFSSRKAGTYVIQVSAASGKPLYVKVIAKAAKPK